MDSRTFVRQVHQAADHALEADAWLNTDVEEHTDEVKERKCAFELTRAMDALETARAALVREMIKHPYNP